MLIDGMASVISEMQGVRNQFKVVTERYSIEDAEIQTLILAGILSHTNLLPKACTYLHKSLILNVNKGA